MLLHLQLCVFASTFVLNWGWALWNLLKCLTYLVESRQWKNTSFWVIFQVQKCEFLKVCQMHRMPIDKQNRLICKLREVAHPWKQKNHYSWSCWYVHAGQPRAFWKMTWTCVRSPPNSCPTYWVRSRSRIVSYLTRTLKTLPSHWI